MEIKMGRIRIFNNLKNIGNLKTTNRLLAECKGEYIAIQDADDISNKIRLETLHNEFLENKDLGIVGSYYYLIDANSSIFECGLLPKKNDKIKDIMLKEVPPLLYPSILVKKSFVDQVGKFRDFFNRKGYADFDWMSRIIEKAECLQCSNPSLLLQKTYFAIYVYK